MNGLTLVAQPAGDAWTERRARLALSRHPVASREVRAQDELALETARRETAMCLGDLIEGDPLGDARLDGRELPTALRAAPGPPGTRRDVAPASR
jgi:hypothetical protein